MDGQKRTRERASTSTSSAFGVRSDVYRCCTRTLRVDSKEREEPGSVWSHLCYGLVKQKRARCYYVRFDEVVRVYKRVNGKRHPPSNSSRSRSVLILANTTRNANAFALACTQRLVHFSTLRCLPLGAHHAKELYVHLRVRRRRPPLPLPTPPPPPRQYKPAGNVYAIRVQIRQSACHKMIRFIQQDIKASSLLLELFVRSRGLLARERRWAKAHPTQPASSRSFTAILPLLLIPEHFAREPSRFWRAGPARAANLCLLWLLAKRMHHIHNFAS